MTSGAPAAPILPRVEHGPAARLRRNVRPLVNLFGGAALSLRAVTKSAIFLLKVFPMLPSRPIDWVTPTPVVERVDYPTRHGMAEGDLYRPATGGPHPGLLVCLGVVPFDVEHPQVARLGAALARAGFAALLHWSPAMRDLRFDPEDAGNLALAYRWLIERTDVDPARSGFLGTCVGGAFGLMAAADSQHPRPCRIHRGICALRLDVDPRPRHHQRHAE